MSIEQATKLTDMSEYEQREFIFLLTTAMRKDNSFFQKVRDECLAKTNFVDISSHVKIVK